jgi:hypothetical protein
MSSTQSPPMGFLPWGNDLVSPANAANLSVDRVSCRILESSIHIHQLSCELCGDSSSE